MAKPTHLVKTHGNLGICQSDQSLAVWMKKSWDIIASYCTQRRYRSDLAYSSLGVHLIFSGIYHDLSHAIIGKYQGIYFLMLCTLSNNGVIQVYSVLDQK